MITPAALCDFSLGCIMLLALDAAQQLILAHSTDYSLFTLDFG